MLLSKLRYCLMSNNNNDCKGDTTNRSFSHFMCDFNRQFSRAFKHASATIVTGCKGESDERQIWISFPSCTCKHLAREGIKFCPFIQPTNSLSECRNKSLFMVKKENRDTHVDKARVSNTKARTEETLSIFLQGCRRNDQRAQFRYCIVTFCFLAMIGQSFSPGF